MLWFLRGLRRGVVTTRYPAGPLEEWTASLPSAPAFHSELLTADLANRLQAACPAGALRHEPPTLVLDLGACTGCGACARHGHGVIERSGEFLLATHRREDLVKRIPISGTSERAPGAPIGGPR